MNINQAKFDLAILSVGTYDVSAQDVHPFSLQESREIRTHSAACTHTPYEAQDNYLQSHDLVSNFEASKKSHKSWLEPWNCYWNMLSGYTGHQFSEFVP